MERSWPIKRLPPVAAVFAEPSEIQDFVSRERNNSLFKAFFPYLYFLHQWRSTARSAVECTP